MHEERNRQLEAVPQRRKIVREKVKGTTGVFRRTTSDGNVRYEISYVDRSGKQRWVTTGDKLEEAKRRRAELVAKPQEQRPAPARELFGDVAELWFEAKRPKLRDRTVDYYRSALDLVLLPRFGRVRLARIDADAIAGLVRELERDGLHAIDPARPKRPLGHSSISNYLKPLQQTLAYAARRGWIASNPFSVLTADDRPTRNDEDRERAHEWTGAELASLLAASRRLAARKAAPESRPYDYSTLLLTAATLGLRLGEVLGLRWEDFDKDAGELRVERQWLRSGEYGPPKTRAGKRTLALPGDLRDEFIALRLRSRYSGDGEPIFASRQGTALRHRNVTRRGFEAARDEAKLPGSLSFHDLRHAAASRLIASGIDDVVVADQLGHGDSRITRSIYAHVFDRRAKMDAVRVALAGVGVAVVEEEA